MKRVFNNIKKITALTLSLLFVSVALLASGESSKVVISGTSNSAAGDYVVTGTDEVYHYQGQEFKVYNVYYDNPSHNMKIAVADNENCRTFIAYTDDFWFMYNCTREGFGVRKALFKSETIRDEFSAHEYHDQTVLVKSRKIEKDEAISLIAAYLPKLQA